MIGVTICTHDDWSEIGRKSARRMAEMSGIDCVHVHPEQLPCKYRHPSWAKCHAWELIDDCVSGASSHDSVLLFDSDIVALRMWCPKSIFRELQRPFIAVPDDNHDNVLAACKRNNLPFPNSYVNAGMTLFGREHQPIWDAVWSHHETANQPWYEQNYLNIELQKFEQNGGEVVRLPRRFNRLNHGGAVWTPKTIPPGTVNVHNCSLGDAPRVAKEQRAWMEAF